MDTAPIGTTLFFDWLKDKCSASSKSLEALSGYRVEPRPTNLIARVSGAWTTPMQRLTVEQVRLLTSQKMGLEWLAEPLCLFVREYPTAFVTLYSGDLSVAALRAFSELLARAPEQARAMADAMFEWDSHWTKTDPAFAKELHELVRSARVSARGHS